jgi:type IV pilus assembly protein PilN
MARINLLPWRDDRRQVRKREFWTAIGAMAFASVIAVAGAWYFMTVQNENQDARNTRLQTEIDGLKKKIEEIKDLEAQKAKLLTKKEIIENLQGDRSLMVHLFDQMAKTMPDGVMLDTIKQASDSIELQGKAQSEASVAQYMRNLDASAYLKDPDLNIVTLKEDTVKVGAAKATEDVRTSGFRKAFTLKISVDRPKDPTKLPESEGGTMPDAAPPVGAAAALPVPAAEAMSSALGVTTPVPNPVTSETAPAPKGGK